MSRARLKILLVAVITIAILSPLPTFAFSFADTANDAGVLLVSVFAFITGMAGWMLNEVVSWLVLGMGDIINNRGVGLSINAAWSVIRDVMNIAFIFGFVYIGFLVILDASSNQAKKLLPPIIIAALLINFSLFITKALIDVTNIAAIEIYQSFPIVEDKSDKLIDFNYGISGAFMQKMGLIELVTARVGEKKDAFKGFTTDGTISYFFALIIFMLVAAFAFAAGAVLLIIRFVALVLIMIFSPLMFAGMIFPKAQKLTSVWWSKALSYAFFAPAYMLMLWIAFVITSNSPIATANRNSFTVKDMVGGSPAAFDVILNFLLICAFLIASVLVAQKMGIAGGDTVMKVGNNLRGRAQSYIGRNTAGWISRGVGKGYDKMQAGMSSGKGARVARGALNALTLGLTSDRTLKKAFKAGSGAGFGGTSRDDIVKESESRDVELSRVRIVGDTLDKISKHLKKPDDITVKIEMEKALADTSNSQLIEMMGESSDRALLMKVVGDLSTGQVEAVYKADEVSDADKSEIRQSRSIHTSNRLISATRDATSIEQVIKKASAKDLEALGYQTVLNNAGLLRTKQIDDLNLTSTQLARLKTKRKEDINDEFRTEGPANIFDHFNDTESAKLPGNILMDTQSVEYLNTNILSKIPDNDDISASERGVIKANILDHYTGTMLTQYENFFKTPIGQRYP